VSGGWIFTSFQLTAKDPQQKYHLSVHFFLDKDKIWEYIPKKKIIFLHLTYYECIGSL
jgi:hypothetical protein